jgi:UDP-GlcNAc:undecaprenyl-phosphate GlcNAc-1-phosphate transferase
LVFPNLRYAIPFVSGALLALLLTPFARTMAFWLGAIDHPGERRIHSVPMPRLGGLVIYLALAFSLAPVVFLDAFVGRLFLGSAVSLVLIVSATMVLAIGVLDDCGSVAPWIKLAVEVVASVLVVFAGFRIGTIFNVDLGWLSTPISIFWIITVVNGVNLIDGLDGLAVGASLISSATLFAVSLYLKDVRTAVILAGLCGTLIGFLYYNFHPARLFLGDSGALLIGFVIAIVGIQSSSKSATVVAVLAPALAIGLPLAEIILTTLRRTLRIVQVAGPEEQVSSSGRPSFRRSGLFTADRGHIHHRLLALGVSHRTTVVLLYGVCVAFGVVAFALSYQKINLLLILAGAVSAGGALVPRLDLNAANQEIILPRARLSGRLRWLPYVFLDLGLIIASWFGALLYNRSPLGPAVAQINAAGPLLVTVQMACLIIGGMYRRERPYAGLTDLLELLKPVAMAAIGGWFVLAAARGFDLPPLGLVLIDSYLLATLVCGSRVALRMIDYFVSEHDDSSSLTSSNPVSRDPMRGGGSA